MANVEATVPRYVQIADSLLDQIETGELAPGTRLPPERTLSELFDVNRVTLRRALGRLEAQGLIIRKHGEGNFIAEPKIERQTERLVSFTNAKQQRGLLPGAKVIEIDQRPVEAAIAKQLDVPVLTPVFHMLRLRMANQEPVMLEQLWVPVQYFPQLESHDLNNRSVYEIMETEYGISITRTQRSLEPVIATKFEAELLGINTGAPLMLERRLGFDQNANCIEFGKDLYRGDRFRFVPASIDE
ncbi:MAG: GntR family transcriptional regulator [Anaerolineales bacterium]|nr:GntR family transcriptional regulator [Anaerolineales bacterium]